MSHKRLAGFLSATALAAVLSFSAGAANAAVTIQNGSFELGPDPGVFTTLGNGNTSITGWTVGGDSIDYIGSYWQPGDGNRSIDLSGNGKGSIWQDLTGLTVGTTYHVKFLLAGNPDGGASTKVAVASDGGTQADVFMFSQPGNTKASMGWTQQTFSFMAFDPTARLAFSATANDPYGPAIDGVSISPVPEPATWAMMIIGFGGAGAMLRRNRQRHNDQLLQAA